MKGSETAIVTAGVPIRGTIVTPTIGVKGTEAALMGVDHLQAVITEQSAIIEPIPVGITAQPARTAAARITVQPLHTTTLMLHRRMHHLDRKLIRPLLEWQLPIPTGAAAAQGKNAPLRSDVNSINDDHLHQLPTALK